MSSEHRDFERILLRHGFVLVHRAGGHLKYRHPDGRQYVVAQHVSGFKVKSRRAQIAKLIGQPWEVLSRA